jgi:hypothetical protein
VHIDDMQTEQRWPRYRQDALNETPIQSVLAFEVFVDNDTVGALNLYSDRPRAFGQESIEPGVMSATHIASAWSLFRRSDLFRSALASHDMIGQAKGIIMERFNVDSPTRHRPQIRAIAEGRASSSLGCPTPMASPRL